MFRKFVVDSFGRSAPAALRLLLLRAHVIAASSRHRCTRMSGAGERSVPAALLLPRARVVASSCFFFFFFFVACTEK
ncbi:TPA_asm: MC156R [Molluscum contagiosum virus]|uniref:MC156R n=1 Tax=Molluscum contagiosum virus TaxID=10279 RepID=A0A858A6S0_9POXV|nr:MC156R [Molluscum contagiosum virus]QHW18145.1 MC156R [Molluscum contagiosum virus]DBA40464.1 TPA_asm: MC156R [Molluscum contagiosum virus]